MFNTLINKIPADILMIIKNSKGNCYTNLIHNKTLTSWVTIVEYIDAFQEAHIIKTKMKGRCKLIELTDKGMRIAKSVDHLYKLLNKR